MADNTDRFDTVTVFGGATFDRIARTDFPPVMGASNPGSVLRRPGGVAFNVASVLARLGVATRLVARVGADSDGEAIIAAARQTGIDPTALGVSPSAPTAGYHAVFDDTGNLVIGVADMKICDEITPALLGALAIARRERDFWVVDGEYFAIALDADGRQVDSLTSNNGHLLWSGIVDKTKAKAVVGHLMSDRLFSGWGIRTLAVGESRYNPIGYHNGTIWPFDNSFIAWGLRRYGFKDEAAVIAAGILEASRFFDGRLPEAFGGYPQSMTKYPVQYPTACSPQAWSTGTPLLLLRTMLGLEPLGEHLVVDPAIPTTIGQMELLDIPGRWGRIDAFGRGRVDTSRVTSKRRKTRH